MAAYRVSVCPACERRRRITEQGRHSVGPRRYRDYRCSQGHDWYEEMGTLERITEITLDSLVPSITDQFTRDSPLFTTLRSR